MSIWSSLASLFRRAPVAATPARRLPEVLSHYTVAKVLHTLGAADPPKWAALAMPGMTKHGINTPRRIAAYLATICHESEGLRQLRESLNYKPEVLIEKFGRDPRPDGLPPRITRAQAIAYGRIDKNNAHLWPGQPHHAADQRSIAMLIYGGEWGRRDLGNRPGTDDPWIYIGAGPTQLTGFANHKRFADTIGRPVESMPAVLVQPGPGLDSAAHFWGAAGCNDLADAGDVAAWRRRVNGGLIGLADVKVKYGMAVEAMG